MQRNTDSTLLALSLCAILGAAPIMAGAEDIDIFTGASAGTNVNPRILIVLDNTSNWSRQSQKWPGGATQGQSEAHAIQSVLQDLDGTVSLGLMEFVTGGNANDDGGFIRSAVRPMTTANKTAFNNQLDTIYNNITSPDEKRNSNTPYGDLMYDAYNYFAGELSLYPSATLASKADTAGYTSAYTRFASPLTADNTCGRSFVIFIGNPNQSGPTSDSAANSTALATLTNNRSSSGALLPVTQLGLPNFTSQTLVSDTTVGTTAACYATPAAAAAGITPFASDCANFTDGCKIGPVPPNAGPVACPAGSRTYTVTQSVYTPASGGANGTTTVGTAQVTTAASTGAYDSASQVPASDRGGLTCPAASGNTTYACTYSVGSAIAGSATTSPGVDSTSCYSGVGTQNNSWDPASSTDHGTLSCVTASETCTWSGVLQTTSNASCNGQRKKVTITKTATPKPHFTITQTATPTTTTSGNAGTPASTATNVLGKTAQCYASPPASTTDYTASCTGTNISCTYGAPTATSMDSCPAGTNVYTVVGTNTVLTNVPTNTVTADTGPRNADEWARLMHDKGIPVSGTTTRPPVTTYTIDVYNAQPDPVQTSLLMSMAKAGGGKYFAAKNERAIVDAIKEILVEIQAVNTSFASTSLPVNATNRSQNENQVFIGMFRPDADAKPRWFGNMKRYQLVDTGATIELGDVEGRLAVNTLTGFVTPCAQSYWTGDSGSYWGGMGLNPDPASGCTLGSIYNADNPSGARIPVTRYSDGPDGPLVEKGAAAQILRQGNVGTTSTASHAVNRTMYTVSGGAFTAFNATSSGLDPNLVKFIRGEDVMNEKGTGDVTTTRPSIHGDVIHSRPLPVNYGGTLGVTVFYGANDGTLHAVNAANGVERWSFVAPEFFGRLGRLMSNSPLVSYPNLSAAISPPPTPKDYFFDGSIGVFQNADSSNVWIYPTMRRGGRMIYGINATDPASPTLLWKAGCPNLADDTGCTTGMSGIGQTWSTPSVSFVKGYGTNPVVIVGGGYDACEDADSATPACTGKKGGVIYILDAATGAVLRSFATDRAVAADVSLVDIDNDGKPDYAYAADTGGNIYRIAFIDGPVTRVAGAPADWSIRKVAYTSGGGRKFLFAPALLATRGMVYVAIGSGDREHPLQAQYPYANVVNRFYVYKDDLAAPALTLAKDMDGLLDYTAASTCTTAPVLPASTSSGWFMNLNQNGQGEQVVTSALIASGMVTFSTNRPIAPSAGTCSSSLGQARGYWVNLFNASGAIDVAGACGGSRSSVFAGGGLPPSPVMASSVPIGKNTVSVVIGAVQKGGASAAGISVAISPQRIRPTNQPKRKRAYSYVSGD